MKTDMIQELLSTVETEVRSRPSPLEFEMAYQVRVVMERIRFAIKHTELYAAPCAQLLEANLQLVDALDRLESLDRRFQVRSRTNGVTPT